MGRGVGVLLLFVVTIGIILVVPRTSGALAESDFFRVEEIRLEGHRYLDQEEVERMLGVGPASSVWDDLDVLSSRLRRHALVEDAQLRRRLPGTLVVQVDERTPVALLATPALVPVDRDGRVLPIDPAQHRLDLPLLEPYRDPWEEGVELTPRQTRILAREAAHLAEADPGFLAGVSELAVDPRGDVLIRLADPRVTLRYRPPAATARLRQALRVLEDALERDRQRTPGTVDLRYRDQVVVRFPSSNGAR